jgi:hypothetical protein
MVGGLQSVYVLLNLTQMLVMLGGVAGMFPRRGPGPQFVPKGGPDRGLMVVLLVRCVSASLNTEMEML